MGGGKIYIETLSIKRSPRFTFVFYILERKDFRRVSNMKLPDVERIESLSRTTFYDPSFVRANIGFLSSSRIGCIRINRFIASTRFVLSALSVNKVHQG